MSKQRPMQRWVMLVLAAAAVMLTPALASAQAAEPAAGEDFASSLDEFIKKSKDPTPWLNWGADARLREVFAANLLLNQEDRHFQRYRFRLWATIKPVADFAFNARIVWEPRHFCQPSRVAEARHARFIDEWTVNEAIIDKANIEWKNVFNLPLTVKVGRQDLIFGNGWLVLDGTPLDGSRTIFFDAARLTWDAKDIKTKFDLVYICNNADSDYWLTPICDKDFHNHEQDEMGVILYATNKCLAKTQIDGYFIYKHDEQVLGHEPGDIRGGHLAPWQAGTNADIFAFGARVAGDIDDHWKYRAEFAQELGSKNRLGERVPLCAFGFNSRLSYFCKDNWNNNFRLSYEYLSGDKETTGTDEQFDPLWGRWPQFSEMYAYDVALENRPGETTNLHRMSVGWSSNPMKDLEVCADYSLLFADKTTYSDRTIGGSRVFTNSGCFRGQLLGLLAKHSLGKHIKHHLLAELFCPGDYYADAFNEFAAFLRYEIVFSW